MSLKRRNCIAWVLILLAAVCWAWGQMLLETPVEDAPVSSSLPSSNRDTSEGPTYSTTMPADTTVSAMTEPAVRKTSPALVAEAPDAPEQDGRAAKMSVFLLFLVAVAAAGIGILALSQKNPICGPDGICLIFAILAAAGHVLQSMAGASAPRILIMLSRTVTAFLILAGIRELFGWWRARFARSWCLVHRIAMGCARPQMSLLVFVGWLLLSLVGSVCFLIFFLYDGRGFLISSCGCLAAAGFGLRCLWKYGCDLSHFKQQLSNYQKGLPITVGNGAFAQTEAQLLDVQAQHEEAVRTAVTSERFKVELISNVSHDLRTPLTAILGYSELLQKESLSPEGQEQLRRLNLKAGYMNDLVESLFELTKVSSGVVESKKDEIDLVRLLEQTIGLFDDQLVHAGLTVRRNYCADAIPVITDGARVHQVFANLLGNAIKYALAGTRIYLEVRETEHSFLVRMVNTASYEMDFKPEEIMQRFARGDKARSTKGSGLGLAIAQTYTESVGGSFRVCVDGDQFSAIVELPKIDRNL